MGLSISGGAKFTDLSLQKGGKNKLKYKKNISKNELKRKKPFWVPVSLLLGPRPSGLAASAEREGRG